MNSILGHVVNYCSIMSPFRALTASNVRGKINSSVGDEIKILKSSIFGYAQVLGRSDIGDESHNAINKK